MGIEPNTEGWSITYQVWGWIGAGVAGAIMWTLGHLPKPKRPSQNEQLAEMTRRLARAETTSDIEKMRSDMQAVIGAMREAILTKIDQAHGELAKRVADLERAVDRLDARLRLRKPDRGGT